MWQITIKSFDYFISKFNEIFSLSWINRNRSSVRSTEVCVNQLIAITHEILEAFDCNRSLKVTSVLLVISKAFDEVWHGGMLYKLKSMGISGELYNLLKNYLSSRFQKVLLNGEASPWDHGARVLEDQSGVLSFSSFVLMIYWKD